MDDETRVLPRDPDLDAPDEGAADEEEDDGENMTEDEVEGFLADAILEFAEEGEGPRIRVRTFEEEGVLTRNKGLVVRVGETEFQVTIVRAR